MQKKNLQSLQGNLALVTTHARTHCTQSRDIGTFFSSFFFECLYLIFTHTFTRQYFIPLCREIWRLCCLSLFLYPFSFLSYLLRFSAFHARTLVGILTHTVFRAARDFSVASLTDAWLVTFKPLKL